MDVKVIRLTDTAPAQVVRGASVPDIARDIFGKDAKVQPCRGHVNPEVAGFSVMLGKAEAGRIFAPKGTTLTAPRAPRKTAEQKAAEQAEYDATPRCICKTSTNLDADNRCPRHPVSADAPAEAPAEAKAAPRPRKPRKAASKAPAAPETATQAE